MGRELAEAAARLHGLFAQAAEVAQLPAEHVGRCQAILAAGMQAAASQLLELLSKALGEVEAKQEEEDRALELIAAINFKGSVMHEDIMGIYAKNAKLSKGNPHGSVFTHMVDGDANLYRAADNYWYVCSGTRLW